MKQTPENSLTRVAWSTSKPSPSGSGRSTMYQSVSRVPASAQAIPQKTSPQEAGVKIGGIELQPPLVSVPHNSPSSMASGGQVRSQGGPGQGGTPTHRSPQSSQAWPAQMLSQLVSQQNGSIAQIRASHSGSSQPGVPLEKQQSLEPAMAPPPPPKPWPKMSVGSGSSLAPLRSSMTWISVTSRTVAKSSWTSTDP